MEIKNIFFLLLLIACFSSHLLVGADCVPRSFRYLELSSAPSPSLSEDTFVSDNIALESDCSPASSPDFNEPTPEPTLPLETPTTDDDEPTPEPTLPLETPTTDDDEPTFPLDAPTPDDEPIELSDTPDDEPTEASDTPDDEPTQPLDTPTPDDETTQPLDTPTPDEEPTQPLDTPTPDDEPTNPTLDFNPNSLMMEHPIVNKICKTTGNPLLCLSSVSTFLPKGPFEPVALMQSEIKACKEKVKTVRDKAEKIAADPSTSPEVAESLGYCKENYDSALTNLDEAAKGIATRDVGLMNSMLSAVISDISTCGDTFSEMSTSPNPMADMGDTVSNLASNSLAILDFLHW